MAERFIYNGLPSRVLFGAGTLAALPAEVERLGAKRALILTTPAQASMAEAFARALGPVAAGVFTGARMHTPTDVTDAALSHVRSTSADCLVAVGGGSTTGLGKALALRTDLPQIVVPTEQYPDGYVAEVVGGTTTSAPDAGRVTVEADAGADEVVVRITRVA